MALAGNPNVPEPADAVAVRCRFSVTMITLLNGSQVHPGRISQYDSHSSFNSKAPDHYLRETGSPKK